MAQLFEFEGQQYSFPDDVTQEQIFNYLRNVGGEAPAETTSPEEQITQPGVTGLPPEPAEGLIDRTGELLGQGFSQFAGSTARGVSTGLDYFDIGEDIQQNLDSYAATQEAEAAKVAPIKALQEAEGLGDVVSSAYEYLAQSSPHMAAMLGGAWAGGKSGAALSSFIPAVGWGIPARAIAVIGGSVLGGATATFNSFFGNNVQEAERVKGRRLNDSEMESAAMAAAGQSIADQMISRLLPFRGSPGKIKNTLKKFAQGAGIEGATEVFQDSLEILQANDWDLNSLDTPEAHYRLIESGLAGMSIGGPLAGITGPFTTTPPPIEAPPPVEPTTEEEVTPLLLGYNSTETYKGDPVVLVDDLVDGWPMSEEVPADVEIDSQANGWRLVSGDRVLTPFFQSEQDALNAQTRLRENLAVMQNKQADEIINASAEVALKKLNNKEKKRLEDVARELAPEHMDFNLPELGAALGSPEKAEAVAAEVEVEVSPATREEITWEDLHKVNKTNPELLTDEELDTLLKFKKPLSTAEPVSQQDILDIAEQKNIITGATFKHRKTIGKRVPDPGEKNFRIFAKRITGTEDIYAMNPTQLQVLASELRRINRGRRFEKKTRLPIADRAPYTETQIQRAVKALKTGKTFPQKKGVLQSAFKGNILQTIKDATGILDANVREQMLDTLVNRSVVKKSKTKNKYELNRSVKLRQQEDLDRFETKEVEKFGTEGRAAIAERLEVEVDKIPLVEKYQAAMEERLARRGLADAVHLRILPEGQTIESITGAAELGANRRARGAFIPSSTQNGKHLILLALDAIPMEIRNQPKKINERLAATLDHESIHALREVGLLTPNDMKALESAINTETAWDWDAKGGQGAESVVVKDAQQVRETYLQQAERLYSGIPDITPLQIQEEAMANLFRDHVANKTKLSKRVLSIWEKIVSFFRDIALSAREQGINDARDIFERIETTPTVAPPPTSKGGSETDFALGGHRLEIAPVVAPPADISTNAMLGNITTFFANNPRVLQLMGADPNKWKLDTLIPEGQRVAVRSDYNTRSIINEGALQNVPPELAPMTGESFTMQGVHLLDVKSGNPNLSDVAAYDASVTLDNVEFRVDQAARNDLAEGLPTETPPALTHGDIVQGQDSTDGVPIIFDPYNQHLFVREDNGVAVRGADQVTLVNGKAYARGDIQYWSQNAAPAPIGNSDIIYQDGVPESSRPSLDLTGSEYEVSSLSTFYNPKFKTEPPGSQKVWEIITRLQDRALNAWGAPLADYSEANREVIAKIIAAEVQEALKKSGNAADWYSADIEKMVDLLALNYLELKTDANARSAFSLALSVTSVNTQVFPNMKNALEVYDVYKQTKRFPTDKGWGIAASGMKKKFRQLNKMIDELGLEQTVRFLNTPFTKAQLVKMGFEGSELGGVAPQVKVYGSYLLGPKLGSFYQNLTGNFDTITMDKWFMRTWNRITGQFPTRDKLIQEAEAFITSYHRSAKRLNVSLEGEPIEAATRLASALDKEWVKIKKDGVKAADKQPIHRRAASFLDLLNGDEVPTTLKRKFADETVRRSLEILADYNIDIPPASLQAVIWYPEQDLFRKMGMAPEDRVRSYGAAAEVIMKEKGYGGEIDATLQSLARRRAKPTGRNVGESALIRTEELQRESLTGRDRTRFLRYHTTKSFRESFGPRFGTEKSPTPFSRKSLKTSKFILADGTTVKVPSKALYSPTKKAVNHLSPSGISFPKFVELKYGDREAVSFFYDRIMNAQASSDYADAFTVYPQDVYTQKRLFITEDGSAGFAIDNGYIQSIFKNKNSPYQQVSFSQLVLAVDQHGRRLDAFDAVFPELASFVGFETAARLPFNAEVAASDGIDVEQFQRTFSDFREGRPDLVFMAFDPNNYNLYTEPAPELRQEEIAETYEEALESQRLAVDEIRTGINDGLDVSKVLYELGPLRKDAVKEGQPDPYEFSKVTRPDGKRIPTWGRIIWTDLDDDSKVYPVHVNVRRGFHQRNKDKETMSGWGLTHAKAHDPDFTKLTPYDNAQEAVLAFLNRAQELADLNPNRLGFVQGMKKGKQEISGHTQGPKDLDNRRLTFSWRDPRFKTVDNKITFSFNAYRDTQSGKMELTLITAFPLDPTVAESEARREYQQDGYNPERLSLVARQAAAEVERMTPEQQQKIVTKVVHKGGTLTLPQPKVKPEVRYEVAEVTTTPAFKEWFGNSKVVDRASGKPLLAAHGSFDDDIMEFNTAGFKAHVGTVKQANSRLRQRTWEEIGYAPRRNFLEGSNVIPVYLSIQNPLRMPDVGNWLDSVNVLDNLPSNRLVGKRGLTDKNNELTEEGNIFLRILNMREEAVKLQEESMYSEFEESDLIDDEGNPIRLPGGATPWTQSEDNLEFLDEIQAIIEGAGFDGVVYDNKVEGAGDSYIPFHPAQIKSAIGNVGTFDPTVADIRYEVAEVTTTPDFKKFFEDSKVVDDKGEPLVVYHATDRDFGSFKQISHFGTQEAANDRLRGMRLIGNTGNNIVPVYVNIQNPLDVGLEENSYGGVWENDNQMFLQVAEVLTQKGEQELAAQVEEEIDKGPEDDDLVAGATPTSHKNVIKMLREAGYDGLAYENRHEDAGSISYVTFDPTKIKSVFNRGTFDPATADIRYEISPAQQDIANSFTQPQQPKRSLGDIILSIGSFLGRAPESRSDLTTVQKYRGWFRTNVVDKYDAIRGADLRAFSALGKETREITADLGAWSMFRQLKRGVSIFQTALTRGAPVYQNGLFKSAPIPEGTLRPNGEALTLGGQRIDGTEFGLLQIFERLQANARLGFVNTESEFQSFVVAYRAARLIQEGRQRTLTMRDIITQLALAQTDQQIVDTFNSPDVDLAYVQKVLNETVPDRPATPPFGVGQQVDFKEIFDAYQVWNEQQVQMMVDAGLVSAEMARTWIETSDYIPYYRQMTDDAYDNVENIFSSYKDIRPPEKLTGEKTVWTVNLTTADAAGKSSIIQAPKVFTTEDEAARYGRELTRENADNPNVVVSEAYSTTAPMLGLIETVAQNSLAAIQTSMANVAMQRAVRNLAITNEASVAPPNAKSGTFVTFHVQGEERRYMIHDPAMYQALISVNDPYVHHPVTKLLGMPANLLRNMVTRSPDFMGANMLRDTLSAWALSGKKGIPVFNTMDGFVQALAGSTSAKALAAAGVYAGHDFADDPSNATEALQQEYKRREKPWGNPLKMVYDKLGKWSAASDAATRIKVYEQVMAETGNEAQAVLEAVEVLNFSARGASPVIQIASAVIPFLNARIQGLDLFWRAAGFGGAGMTADPDSARVKRRFLSRAAFLAIMSVSYWAAVKDDEEWQQQEAHSKDLYWIIPNSLIPGYDGPTIRIPKPFEVGLIFATIPERIAAWYFGNETNQDLKEALTRGLTSTLEITYIPQAILPLYEAKNNYSFFTGRRVEPLSYGGIDPGYRYNQRTSELAINLGETLNDFTKSDYISPIRIDHMIKGYGGTLGTYILDTADWAWRNLGSSPDRPSRSMYDFPVLRRFLKETGTGRGVVTQAYQLQEMVNRTLKTLDYLGKRGRTLEAFEYAEKNRMLLSVSPALKDMSDQLRELRAERKNIYDNALMSSDYKRRALEIIAERERHAVTSIPTLRRWAFD